jgi:hypothetical protein
MKTRKLLLLLSGAAIMLFSSFMVFYPNGAPAGMTGSPGDGNNCTSCHGGTATTSTNWITSNIPVGGYIAGQTYQITATNSLTGSGKYGFEISPQNSSGTLLGTMALGANCKFADGNSKYITHSNATSSLHVWTFNWTAPVAGTGSVTFYGAFARNKPGPVTLSSLVVPEQTAALPGAAGPISGSSTVCKNTNSSFSVGTITGATSYVWSVPSGATITSGQGTTSIVANFGSSAVSGNVSVYGTNVAGNGTPSNLAVSVNTVPLQPSAIAGAVSPCTASSQVYSVINVSGVVYNWTVPSGSTISAGQGTSSITVTIGTSSGNINVVPSNSCGGGAEQIKAIAIQLLPGAAGTITGPALIDLATTATTDYSTSGATDATSYQWELSPSGAGTISGTGLTSTVTWSESFIGIAQVRVKAINDCGEGAWSGAISTEVINTTGVTDLATVRGMKVYPSPSNGTFTVALKGINGKAKLQILDATGHELYTTFLEGEESTKLDYDLSPGVYVLLLNEGNNILRQKLVIQ